MACGKLSHHPDSCHLLRIQVETPTSITKIALKEYQKILLLAIPILNVRLAKIHSTQPLNDIAYSPPNTTHATGRKILTNKSVLII
jgi:hypothetical protein